MQYAHRLIEAAENASHENFTESQPQQQLIIITSDTYSNYFAKRDILESKNCIKKFLLNEKISWTFAEAIYQKVIEIEGILE